MASGAIAKSGAKKQANQQYANDEAAAARQFEYDTQAAERQRQWDIEDRDEQRAYSRSALRHLVEDADAAGFSPASVLQSGSAPAYNAAAGFAPLSRTAPTMRAPVRQAVGGSPLAAGIAAAGDAFLQSWDPYANHRKSESAQIMASAIATKNVGALSRAKGSLNIARGSAVSTSTSGSLTKFGPPTKTQWIKDNNVQDMFVPWRDPFNDKIHYLPSADLPELEQMPIPSMGIVANETVNAVNGVRYKTPRVKDAFSVFNGALSRGFGPGVNAPVPAPRRRSGGGGGW